jgi:regulator of replication initiation timing
MLVQSDLDCTFAIDEQPKQPLKAGDTVRIPTALGQHLITAVSADGKDHWKTVVDVDKPVQKVVLIELVKVRAARQAAERQVSQLQQEIGAKEQQAQEVKQKTQALEQQQAAVAAEQKRIKDQIEALQKQAHQEGTASGASLGTNLGEAPHTPDSGTELHSTHFRICLVRPHCGTLEIAAGLLKFQDDSGFARLAFSFPLNQVKVSYSTLNRLLRIDLPDGRAGLYASEDPKVKLQTIRDAILQAQQASRGP